MGNDLISRSAAIEEFYKRVGGDLTIADVEYIEKVLNEVMDIVDGDDGWIPCSSRLPKEPNHLCGTSNEYIVMIEGAVIPTVLEYVGGGEWYGDGVFYSVVAWRHLPAPYRAEKSIGEDYKNQIMDRFLRME